MSIRQGSKMIAGTGKALYDWVGTLQQYMDLQISTNHPEWICYITDDEDAGDSVYTKDEVDVLVGERVLTGHEVVAFQAPTSENNYTWYRKYADGWVEMGGYDNTTRSTSSSSTPKIQITFPVEFADTNYSFVATTKGGYCGIQEENTTARATTGLNISIIACYPNASYTSNGFSWVAAGMAAQGS